VPFHQGLEEDYTTLASNMAGDHLRVVKFQVSQPPEQGTLALPGFSPTDDSLSDLLQADIEREFAAEKFDLKTFPTLSFLPKVYAMASLGCTIGTLEMAPGNSTCAVAGGVHPLHNALLDWYSATDMF